MSSPIFVPIQIHHFDEVKATQVAAWLLNRRQTATDAKSLMGLLYLADREMLSRFGYPVTTDAYRIQDGLPVALHVHDLIDSRSHGFWATHLAGTNRIRVLADPGTDRLSQAVQEVLAIVLHNWGGDESRLLEYVRDLPECKRPDQSAIDYRDILEAVGRSAADIEAIAQEIGNLNAIQDLAAKEP